MPRHRLRGNTYPGLVYIPPAFDLASRSEILSLLRSTPFGHLVTTTTKGEPQIASTPLPFVIDDDLSSVRAHFARANRHWREIDGATALMIIPGVDAYVSPRWYPSKQEKGEVVPTWNYEVVHLHGTITIHDDPAWKLDLVTNLTDHNERQVRDTERADAWEVTDAPTDFIDGQLKAIVGVQLEITKIEAKRKLSQNRRADDRSGAQQGLGRSDRLSDLGTASLMRSAEE